MSIHPSRTHWLEPTAEPQDALLRQPHYTYHYPIHTRWLVLTAEPQYGLPVRLTCRQGYPKDTRDPVQIAMRPGFRCEPLQHTLHFVAGHIENHTAFTTVRYQKRRSSSSLDVYPMPPTSPWTLTRKTGITRLPQTSRRRAEHPLSFPL